MFNFRFSRRLGILTSQTREEHKSSVTEWKDTRLILKQHLAQQLKKVLNHFLLARIGAVYRNDFSCIGNALHSAVDSGRRQLLHLHLEKDRTGKQVSHILRNEHRGRLHGRNRGYKLRLNVEMLKRLVGDAADVIRHRWHDKRQSLKLFRRDFIRIFVRIIRVGPGRHEMKLSRNDQQKLLQRKVHRHILRTDRHTADDDIDIVVVQAFQQQLVPPAPPD